MMIPLARKRFLISVGSAAIIAALATSPIAVASTTTAAVDDPDTYLTELPATDEFDGAALDAEKWSTIRPTTGGGDVVVADGALTIRALAGDLYNAQNSMRNIVLQETPDEDGWQITTKVSFAPGSCCQQAGLILYDDDDNYASLAFSGRANGLGRAFFLVETGRQAAVPSPIDKPIDEWATEYQLKLVSNNGGITGYYSEDGVDWTQVGGTVGDTYDKVGIFAAAGTNGAPVIPATYDYFRVYRDETPPPPPPTALSDVVPIDWNSIGSAPLTGTDAIPGDILAASNEYALTTWWQSKGFNLQDEQKYLNFGGTGEHTIRPIASEATALATALTMGVYDESVTGVSEDEARAKTVRLVSSLAHSHYSVTNGGWSGPGSWQGNWQGALWAALATQAAWLMWDDLDADTQREVGIMIETEADRLMNFDVPYWTDADGRVISVGDTKAEENSWNAMMMMLATSMMPDHPNHARWEEKELELAISAHAKPSDVNSDQVLNGKPLSEWLNGWNIEENGAAYNHDRLHPDYMATMVQQLYAAIPATLAGDPTPEGSLHNMELIYNHFVDFPYIAGDRVQGGTVQQPGGSIYVRDSGQVFYPIVNDWGNSRRLQFVAVDAFASAYGIDQSASEDGQYWLRLHGADARAMQARSDDGRTYLQSDDDNYNGREEWVAMHAAWSVMALWTNQNGDYRVSNASVEGLSDAIAPTVSASIEAEALDNGDYIAPASLAIASSDEGTGVTSTSYRVNGGDWLAYNGPVELGVGTWNIEARAVDGNANTTTTQVAELNVVERPAPIEPALSLSASSVEQGGSINVSGTGFTPGDTLSIALDTSASIQVAPRKSRAMTATPLGDPIELATVSVDTDGTFSTTVTFPASQAPGTYLLTVNGASTSVGQVVTVTAADSGGDGDGSGSDDSDSDSGTGDNDGDSGTGDNDSGTGADGDDSVTAGGSEDSGATDTEGQSSSLPRTGAESFAIGLVALMLLLVGSTVITIAHRSTRTP